MQPRNETADGQGALAWAVNLAGSDAAFLAALAEIYRGVDDEVRKSAALCLGGGACCKFDLMDHKLYLSTGELALLTQEPPPAPACGVGRCPYQFGPRCTARARRPLGCRTFFCQPRSKDFLGHLYERSHRRIRLLHQRHWLPYAYVELPEGLAQLSATY